MSQAPSGAQPMESPYNSVQEADTAYYNYMGESDGQGGDDESSTTTTASDLTGSVDVPDTVGKGEAFTASASIRNQGDQAFKGRAILVVETPERSKPFSQLSQAAQLTVKPSDSVSHEFQAVRGALDVSPGDYTIGVYALGQTQATTGMVASDTASVTGGGDTRDTGTDSPWSEPQHVRELPLGWHLYREDHKQEDKSRYFVSSESKGGDVIFLHPGGEVKKAPHYYTDFRNIKKALRAYAKRKNAGNVPESRQASGRRPPEQKLKRALAKAREQARRRKKLMLVGGAVLVVGGGLYLYRQKQQGQLGQVPVVGDTLANLGGK